MNRGISQHPRARMIRIRRVVNEEHVPIQAQEKRNEHIEASAERFRIERLQPVAFDRNLEMQTIDAWYFRSVHTQNRLNTSKT